MTTPRLPAGKRAMEGLIGAAAAFARHAAEKRIKTRHLIAAVEALYPAAEKPDPYIAAGQAFVAKYGAAVPPMSREEKARVGHLDTAVRAELLRAEAGVILERGAAPFLRGVLDRLEGLKPPLSVGGAGETVGGSRLVEVACLFLRTREGVVLQPVDLFAAARLLCPELGPELGRVQEARERDRRSIANSAEGASLYPARLRRGVKKALKEQLASAAAPERPRLGRAAPGCYQYLLDLFAKGGQPDRSGANLGLAAKTCRMRARSRPEVDFRV